MTRSGLVAGLVLAAMALLACAQSASVLHDGRVLLVGGGTAAIFDPASDMIAATGAPAVVRNAETATVLSDGRVLLTGGHGAGSDEILASSELYDPETGRFSGSGSMATPRYLHSATLLGDGRVLVAGGSPTAGLFSDREVTQVILGAAELFDPATDTWRPSGDLVHGRMGHTATLLPDGRVLVVGGMDADGAIAAAELYDPSTETFAVTGSLATARAGHTATALVDGRVLVVGGSGPEDLDDQAELYDPVTGRFEPAGRLTAVRAGHTATLLADGRVLIVGGVDFENSEGQPLAIATAETWDPSSLTSTPTGSMTVPRVFHTASRLDDGRVLFVGGDLGEPAAPDFSSGAFDVSASSWEVYDPATGSFD